MGVIFITYKHFEIYSSTRVILIFCSSSIILFMNYWSSLLPKRMYKKKRFSTLSQKISLFDSFYQYWSNLIAHLNYYIHNSNQNEINVYIPLRPGLNTTLLFQFLHGLVKCQHGMCRGSKPELSVRFQAYILVYQVKGIASSLSCIKIFLLEIFLLQIFLLQIISQIRKKNEIWNFIQIQP